MTSAYDKLMGYDDTGDKVYQETQRDLIDKAKKELEDDDFNRSSNCCGSTVLGENDGFGVCSACKENCVTNKRAEGGDK